MQTKREMPDSQTAPHATKRARILSLWPEIENDMRAAIAPVNRDIVQAPTFVAKLQNLRRIEALDGL